MSQEDLSQPFQVEELSTEALKLAIQTIYLLTGITMGDSKKTLIQGRLSPRMRDLKIARYFDYLDRVQSDEHEKQIFINLVTTNESSFFRTPRIWTFLFNEFLPTYFASQPSKPLRIWSAAASTGEEAYSMAICCEEFKASHPSFNYQVFGTDISTDVLDSARRGTYELKSVQNFQIFNESWFRKYVTPVPSTSGHFDHPEQYQIVESLKRNITFFKHNLFTELTKHSDLPIVFLRNVMIYFEVSDKIKVLGAVAKSMSPGGTLVIGESESLASLKTQFKFVEPFIYRNDVTK